MGSRCLYHGSADEIAALLPDDELFKRMWKNFVDLCGHAPEGSEYKSWRSSIPTVIHRLVAAGLGGVHVLLELKTPITDIRMDVVLVGSRPDDGGMAVMVVENKQWSEVWPEPDSELVRWRRGAMEKGGILHPVNQVWGYRQVLIDFIPLLREAKVTCLVNMHNAERHVLKAIAPTAQGLSAVKEMSGYARMYGLGEDVLFERFLRAHLSAEKADAYARDLLEAPVIPTESLMITVSEGIGKRTVFTLLDEQRLAYDYVRSRITKSKKGDRKEVVIIVGGPGTGKSVIALELLRQSSRQGLRAVHATGSKAFTTTLRTNVGAADNRAGAVFRYFNNFSATAPNDLDVLVADEAHRLRADLRSDRGPRASQVAELIRAARVPVFLLDDHQKVRPSEAGSVELITETARELGAGVHTIDLRHEFRCGGSPEFLAWVERLLELKPKHPLARWRQPDDFSLHVARTPAEMEDFLAARIREGHTARIAAGFCWRWGAPRADGSLPVDVKIGDWHRPWNSRATRRVNGVPTSSLWATEEGGFGQIGCIYSAQGFEYDYAGVIFGPDLVWTAQGWRANPRANRDGQVNDAPDFNRLVRNIYRVLATRGMRGAVLYSTDATTNRFFAEELGVPYL
ncbi:DUF2075 domain-containing protein [Streptomonospora sp. S1-112]|uniref:DUF2075 domain-containing protein n=1 Tax=Streptomonospora mangrovi TaxID=2883123 RepID=A0A9X3NTA9_9ACTN|nr:DUF2075 domain-containing protein [Streptomonospora mangrovi]MDA0566465.1 DUF2075 domain-containing protein [Streptomonospora mangrovi]